MGTTKIGHFYNKDYINCETIHTIWEGLTGFEDMYQRSEGGSVLANKVVEEHWHAGDLF